MTTKEMVSVMKAYEDGKEIEYKSKNAATWMGSPVEPVWDWASCDYRIKSEPEYAPYDSVTEVDKEKWLKHNGSGRLYRIIGLDPSNNTVRLSNAWFGLKDLFEYYTYEDGTHFGKKVSE